MHSPFWTVLGYRIGTSLSDDRFLDSLGFLCHAVKQSIKFSSGSRRDRNDTVGEFRFTFLHPKIDKYNGTLFRRAADCSHRFVTRYSSLVTL